MGKIMDASKALATKANLFEIGDAASGGRSTCPALSDLGFKWVGARQRDINTATAKQLPSHIAALAAAAHMVTGEWRVLLIGLAGVAVLRSGEGLASDIDLYTWSEVTDMIRKSKIVSVKC